MVPGRAKDAFAPNAFLEVTSEHKIIFTLARVEMGQGTMTSETMLIAEELNQELSSIEVVNAPAHSAYINPEYSVQSTGGSNSTKTSFNLLRKAAAVVREALIGAAAEALGVARDTLKLEGIYVSHQASKQRLKIGSLIDAAKRHIDSSAQPKPSSQWKLIGKSQQRLDARAKVDGSAIFGADPTPKNVETAVVVHGPFGAKLLSFQSHGAEKLPGVRAILEIPSGVAIVADRYPQARKAVEKLEIVWSESNTSSQQLLKEYSQILEKDAGSTARSEGDASEIIDKAGSETIRVDYEFPFLAHAAMEPMVATAWVRPDKCEVWAPTQSTSFCQNEAMRITGLSGDQVIVYQTFIGGGFGRKSYIDVVAEAVTISQKRGRPIRVVWSREDDIQQDLFRPASRHRLRSVLKNGKPQAWEHRMISQSSTFTQDFEGLMAEIIPSSLTGLALWGAKTFATDNSIVEGAKELPYDIKNLSISYHAAECPVPSGIWRSVGHSQNAFVTETFIDELATRSGHNPYEFRKELLTKHPRHLSTLELAVAKSGWGDKLPEGHALGLAVHESFNSFCTQVAEVSLLDDGTPRVHRVVAAVDCGTVVNPDGVIAQIEGGIIFGLSAAIKKQEITIEKGRVRQSNFHDFEVLRMHECPQVEVYIVPSEAPPTGVGEVGVPPIAPAVANALYVLTGRRKRRLPLV